MVEIKTSDQNCGGTILDRDTVLCAAHCGIKLNATISAGIKNVEGGTDDNRFSVKNVINHPAYDQMYHFQLPKENANKIQNYRAPNLSDSISVLAIPGFVFDQVHI